MRLMILVMALGMGFGGCFNASAYNMKSAGKVKKMASFALKCPEQSLTLKDIAKHPYNDEVVGGYGVSGCGNRATYRLGGQSSWIMEHIQIGTNATVSEPPKATSQGI